MKKLLLLFAVMLAALTFTSAADARYWLSKKQAQTYARDYVYDVLAFDEPYETCRPQGWNRGKWGYVYNRWVCGWAGYFEDNLYCGAVVITGSVSMDYKYRTWKGEQRC